MKATTSGKQRQLTAQSLSSANKALDLMGAKKLSY
jgi:hypothetical protein